VRNPHDEEKWHDMTAQLQPPADGVRDVTAELVAEFRGALPVDLIRAEVAGAERELRGQTSPQALAELLHRLARHRLQERLDRADRRR
jgi:hypothetical protein